MQKEMFNVEKCEHFKDIKVKLYEDFNWTGGYNFTSDYEGCFECVNFERCGRVRMLDHTDYFDISYGDDRFSFHNVAKADEKLVPRDWRKIFDVKSSK